MHINMGTLSTNDCIAYIDKLEAFGITCSPGKVIISASTGGYGNTDYYFDDNRNLGFTPYGLQARDAVILHGVSPTSVTYIDHIPRYCTPHILTANNVSGYFAWGWNGCMGGNYAQGGGDAFICSCSFPGVVFAGDSRWYIIQTGESFNGRRLTHQGNFVDWFSINAFGGLSYENTPVGAITHVDEPTGGLHHSAIYFGLWVLGKNLGICAWNSSTFHGHTQVVGDPLVSR